MQLRFGAARKIIIPFVILSLAYSSVPAIAAPPRSVIRATKKRLARTKALLAKQNREVAKVRGQLARMDIEFAVTVEKYNDIREQLRQTQDEIEENLARLKDAIEDLNGARDLLNERVVNIYKNGKADTVDVFLNADGFHQVLVSFDLLRFIADADKDMVVKIAAKKRRVQDVQEVLLAKRTRQYELQADIEAQKERIQEQIAARRLYLSRLNKDVRALLARKRAQEQRIAAAQARLAALALARGQSYPLVGSGGRQDVVRIALSFRGVPYVWGGESRSGVDCSGLVMLVFRGVGISLPHYSGAQYGYGRSVSRGQLLPGDLVFFSRGGAGGIYHVAIYIGNGNIVEAPFTGASVWVKALSAKSNYYGAKRLL